MHLLVSILYIYIYDTSAYIPNTAIHECIPLSHPTLSVEQVVLTLFALNSSILQDAHKHVH